MGIDGQHHALDCIRGKEPAKRLMQLMIAWITTIVSEASHPLGYDTTLLDGWFEVF